MNDETASEDRVSGGAIPLLEDGARLGEAMRARREQLGLSLAAAAFDIKVPAKVLAAIEDEQLDALPARPFALGHTRAYAQHLGVNETLAVERMRTLYDQPRRGLETPAGIAFDDKPGRSPLWIIAGVGVVAAVLGWNVWQRLSLVHTPEASDLTTVPASWTETDAQPLVLGPSRPAPPDQTTPAPYITPGLEEVLIPAMAGAGVAAVDVGEPIGAAFNPRGVVYGEPALSSGVILQARRPALMVVRAPDGTVRFARQMQAGEAYRAPRDVAMVIDVSNPALFDVFLNGERTGTLEQPLTQLSSLNNRAQALARQAAAEEEAADRAAERAAQARLRELEARPPEQSQAVADPTAPQTLPQDTGPSLPPPAIQTAPLATQ